MKILSLNFEKRDTIGGRETESFVRQSEIIGREKDKENIIESLIVNYVGNEAHITVVAIVGFGGLGKTALAQLVYNDEKVAKDFGVRMWVCVSEDFHVKLIIKKILRCIITDLEKNLDLEQLQRKLGENLGGKRYLLVLDDVWNKRTTVSDHKMFENVWSTCYPPIHLHIVKQVSIHFGSFLSVVTCAS